MFVIKEKNSLSAVRSRNRRRLRNRANPDYCYSDEQNESVEVPDFEEKEVAFEDDTDYSEFEELIEAAQHCFL